MGFRKDEQGIQTDDKGNIVAVKEDRHVLPGDPEWGNHVPVSTAPEDSPETAALKKVAEEDPNLEQLVVDDTITITDAEAREALNTVSPVGAPQRPDSARASNESGGQGGTQTVGVLDKLSAEKAKREEAAAKNAEKSEQSLSKAQQDKVDATRVDKPKS